MKSTARITALLMMFFVPAFVSAQASQGQGGINYNTGTGFSGSYNYSAFQQYTGGTFGGFGLFGGGMTPGGMIGLGGGIMPGGILGGGGFGVAGVAITIINIINGVLVPLLFAISFLMFLYGIAKAYILSPGDEEAVKNGHKILLWGLIGFAVMISVWGLVNVVVSTFGLAAPFGSR